MFLGGVHGHQKGGEHRNPDAKFLLQIKCLPELLHFRGLGKNSLILASGHPVRIEEAPDVVFVPKPYDVDRVARKLASAMDAARAGADSEFATLDGLTRSAGNAR